MRSHSLALLALCLACSPSAPTPSAPTAPAEPWTLTAATPDTTDGIRVLVLHDMEGLSGQSDPKTFDFGQPEYRHGQELLAADVNAVIAGLYAGGATAVDVVDGHGSGNPDPDVRADLLDKRAKQVLRDTEFDTYFDLVTPKVYDAVAVVGMHAKTGSRGFASHTYTLGIGMIINGRPITETELVGLSFGRQDIPVIFASGDDRLAQDLTGMNWIEYVTVKKATAADSAVLRPLDEAHADLTAHAKKAVENLRAGKTQAMKVGMPLKAGLRAVYPASLAMLEGIPGISYADSTVTFAADSLRPAYDAMEKLVRLAGALGYTRILQRDLVADKSGQAVLGKFREDLERAWFDYESGRWKPTPPPPAPAGRKYHGYQ